MLLDSGGKATLAINWQRACVNRVSSTENTQVYTRLCTENRQVMKLVI